MRRETFERPDGARIAYTIGGDGPAVALIQGLGMPGAAWQQTTDRLLDRGYRCVVIDNRGTGHSSPVKRPFSLATLADDAAAAIHHALDEEPAYVLGISLGGMIAQHLTLRHPERVRALLLAATTCGLPHSLLNGAFFTPEALLLLGRVCFSPGQPKLEDLQRLLAHEESLPRLTEIFLGWDGMFKDAPTPARTFLFQLLAATFHSTGAHLPRITHPTRVITGEGDFLIPSRNSELLASLIPNARRIVIPRAGHIFPQEHPDVLPQVLDELHQELAATEDAATRARHAND